MKIQVLLLLSIFLLSVWSVNALRIADPIMEKPVITDNSIEQELDKNNTQALDFDFNLKTFDSCENMEDVMWDYVKDYWNANWKNRPQYPINYNKRFWGDDMIMELQWASVDMEESISSDTVLTKSVSPNTAWSDFSETNVQVAWVDESDIIKTDGKHIYYYNSKDKNIYIVNAEDKANMNIVKKIQIPKNFYSPVLYIEDNRLIIVSGWYSNTNYKNNYWYSRNQKTYTVVFDTTDIKNTKLIKLYASEGNFRKSRKIWDYVYVISNNSFNIPYHNFKSEDDIELSVDSLIPRAIELTKTSDTLRQNLELKDIKYPYNFKAGKSIECNQVSYSLPGKETLKKFDFSPSYNIISVINVNNVEEWVETDIIAGSNSEIFMSHKNLYLTSHMYQSYDFSCPRWNFCMMPYYSRGENTLIHKVNIDKNKLSYQDSTIIPGQPLTQYSMDEHEDNFRIITQKFYPERKTGVYILDKDLELLWSLDGLWKTEDFKSSRFMWDKLFLVTFKQIDPFYVIDMSTNEPKVMWELKIPGYSTYLHPYDENHIIGLGYNTTTNKWWGTVNDGLKIDLYEIDYNKKPAEKIEADEEWNFQENLWDIYVAQKYTKTLWANGSYSEALQNPRMFVWNAVKKTLLLPATVYLNSPEDYYKKIDFYQGLFSFEIDKDKWILENYKLSHIDFSDIEAERTKECSQYSQKENEATCKLLLDGTQYCAPKKYNYVPEYCFADSNLWEYKAKKSYNYRNDYVKRALWIGDAAISISDNQIMTSDLDTWKKIDSVNLK
jgi:inhibitor of cysteine peptidase